jgi:hypothetical protein
MAESDDFMRAFVEQYRAVHRVIRDELRGLDAATLSWQPAEGANSIAVLVTHLIGSEIEAVRTLAGVQSDRVRAQEFESHQVDAAQLLALVDRADANLDELSPRIGPAQLAADHVRPGALDKTPKPGVHVLMHSLAHAREHLGQLLLTRQLAAASR